MDQIVDLVKLIESYDYKDVYYEPHLKKSLKATELYFKSITGNFAFTTYLYYYEVINSLDEIAKYLIFEYNKSNNNHFPLTDKLLEMNDRLEYLNKLTDKVSSYGMLVDNSMCNGIYTDEILYNVRHIFEDPINYNIMNKDINKYIDCLEKVLPTLERNRIKLNKIKEEYLPEGDNVSNIMNDIMNIKINK